MSELNYPPPLKSLISAALDFYLSPRSDDQATIDLFEAAFAYAESFYGELSDELRLDYYAKVIERRGAR